MAGPASEAPTASPRRSSAPGKVGNIVFRGISTGAGFVILLVLALVALFLLYRSWDTITADDQRIADLTFTRGETFWPYVLPLIFGTVLFSVIALVIAVPLSVSIALFISHYAPRRMAQVLGYLIDLLAAIPSVLYGMWGFLWLEPAMRPFFVWISDATNWLNGFAPWRYTLGYITTPLFGEASTPARVALMAGVVLAIMILPIVTATIREVFLQTPRLHEEASLALGATRWEMIRQAVFPFGRSGIITASMLGLGRALGETMAVLMIVSPGFRINFNILQAGQHQAIAPNIANTFGEGSAQDDGLGGSVLIATGLVLFVITFGVNLAARWIIARRAEFSGAN